MNKYRINLNKMHNSIEENRKVKSLEFINFLKQPKRKSLELNFTESDLWYKLFELPELPKSYYSTYNITYKSDKLYLTFGDQIFLKYFITVPKGEYQIEYFATTEYEPCVIRFNLKSNTNPVVKEKMIFDSGVNVEGYCAVIDSNDIKNISNDKSSTVSKEKIVWDKLEDVINDDEEIFDIEDVKRVSPANTPILIFQFDDNSPQVVAGYDATNKISEFYIISGSKGEIISELKGD